MLYAAWKKLFRASQLLGLSLHVCGRLNLIVLDLSMLCQACAGDAGKFQRQGHCSISYSLFASLVEGSSRSLLWYAYLFERERVVASRMCSAIKIILNCTQSGVVAHFRPDLSSAYKVASYRKPYTPLGFECRHYP